jgi:hypothetical protein
MGACPPDAGYRASVAAAYILDMARQRRKAWIQAAAVVGSSALLHCSNASTTTCYPDNDGVNNVVATLELTVDDTGFSKTILSTQNDSPVTLTLVNTGTKPHGFEVGCTTTSAPAGCATKVCFPDGSTIAPIAPGTRKTISFQTPTPDGIIYPFKSNGPDDSNVTDLNDGQWSLM